MIKHEQYNNHSTKLG